MLERAKATLSAAAIAAAAFSFAVLMPQSQAQAPSLQEQLSAQYKIAKMGSDTGGYSVVEEGTLLAVQKGGILSVPYSEKQVLPTKYENGQVHGPSGMMVEGKKRLLGHFSQTASQGQSTHLIAKGDKVYPTDIKVNPEKDTVTMGVVECDKCNNVDPPTYNKAIVVFQFPHGSVAKASAGEVEDTIGQLFSISDDQNGGGDNNNQGGGNDQGNDGGGNGGGGNGGGNGGGGGQQQQAEPQTIEKGMTPDQVQNSLGKPDKIVNLGAKQLYIYKDMKVTFVNGKVTDVQ
jgi:hypothetical protein